MLAAHGAPVRDTACEDTPLGRVTGRWGLAMSLTTSATEGLLSLLEAASDVEASLLHVVSTLSLPRAGQEDEHIKFDETLDFNPSFAIMFNTFIESVLPSDRASTTLSRCSIELTISLTTASETCSGDYLGSLSRFVAANLGTDRLRESIFLKRRYHIINISFVCQSSSGLDPCSHSESLGTDFHNKLFA